MKIPGGEIRIGIDKMRIMAEMLLVKKRLIFSEVGKVKANILQRLMSAEAGYKKADIDKKLFTVYCRPYMSQTFYSKEMDWAG